MKRSEDFELNGRQVIVYLRVADKPRLSLWQRFRTGYCAGSACRKCIRMAQSLHS